MSCINRMPPPSAARLQPDCSLGHESPTAAHLQRQSSAEAHAPRHTHYVAAAPRLHSWNPAGRQVPRISLLPQVMAVFRVIHAGALHPQTQRWTPTRSQASISTTVLPCQLSSSTSGLCPSLFATGKAP